jgi:hypothetical protein
MARPKEQPARSTLGAIQDLLADGSQALIEGVQSVQRVVLTTGRGVETQVTSILGSLVSIDMVHWQVEGVLLSSATANLFYSSLVDDLLVFVRQDPGVPVYLAMARVAMP